MTEQTSQAWDREAAGFDEAADHGLRDPAVRDAWRQLLRRSLPPPPARVADLGCGAGSLTLLVAELGHLVDGVDLSTKMLRLAQAKAERVRDVCFHHGDAGAPPLPAGRYDVVLCRHVLWALADPPAALRAWTNLLAAQGRLVVIEGQWSTGAGLAAADVVRLLGDAGFPASRTEDLDDPLYWGGPTNDQRYIVTAGLGP